MEPNTVYKSYTQGDPLYDRPARHTINLEFSSHVSDEEHKRIVTAIKELEDIVDSFNEKHTLQVLGTKEFPLN